MSGSIAALKVEVARVEARMANRPAATECVALPLACRVVAEEIARRTPIGAEYVALGMVLGRQLRLGAVEKVELALAIEQRLRLVELLDPPGWRVVGDIVRDVARCRAEAGPPAQG